MTGWFDEDQVTGLRKKAKFDLSSAARRVEGGCLPRDGESIRLISPAGGFSSCVIVMAIAQLTGIRSAKITTLRVGRKEALALERLMIDDVEIVCGGISLENAEKYDYAGFLPEIADRNGWKVRYCRNHSKVILLDTESGKIVIETSSNFNENPQIEQFCITNDEAVYRWYLTELRRLGVFDAD